MTCMFSVKPLQSTWEELPDETLVLTDSDLFFHIQQYRILFKNNENQTFHFD